MKTINWIRGVLQVLCLLVFACLFDSCDLQNEPPIEPQIEPRKPVYRLMASGFGAVISISTGIYQGYEIVPNYPVPDLIPINLGPIESWGSSGNHNGEGWWQKEIPEDEVQKQKPEHVDNFDGLYLRAVNPTEAGGQLSTRIVHVDEMGNEIVLDEHSTTSGNTCVSFVCLWHPNIPGSGGPVYTGGPHNPGYKVICAELHRQGLMNETIFKADEAFGRYLYDNHRDVLLGYHLWAKPVVRWMQKSKSVTRIVASVATPWSYEMAYRMGARDKGCLVGKILMDVGVPICRIIGWAMIWAGNMGTL